MTNIPNDLCNGATVTQRRRARRPGFGEPAGCGAGGATNMVRSCADLNVKAAAEALLIHVNTAHCRPARVAEKTGCDLRRLPDVIDPVIAIRLNQTQPEQ